MFISQALAAEAGAAGVEPFYASTSFLVTIAFVLFFAFFGKIVFKALGAMLDDRSDKIKNELDEATRLREDAQDMLAEFERKQHEALKEAEDIVTAAREEATRLADEAKIQLEESLKRSEQTARERIAQAEAQAIQEVRTTVVDVAMEATRHILESELSGVKADRLVDDAIKNLKDKLH